MAKLLSGKSKDIIKKCQKNIKNIIELKKQFR